MMPWIIFFELTNSGGEGGRGRDGKAKEAPLLGLRRLGAVGIDLIMELSEKSWYPQKIIQSSCMTIYIYISYDHDLMT